MIFSILSAVSVQTSLVFLLVLLISWLVLREWLTGKKYNLAPGPKRLIANAFDNISRKRGGHNSMAHTAKMRERYKCDISCVTAGWRVAVLLHTFDLIKQTFVKREDLVDRPPSFFFMLQKHRGLSGSNGKTWKEQRRFTLSVLRDFGMGKTLIEQKIQEEAAELLKEFESYVDKEVDPQYLISTSVSNIICSIVFGQRYKFNDEEFRNYLKMINFIFTKARRASLATDMFPFLHYLPGDLFYIKKTINNHKQLMSFIQTKIDQQKEFLDPDNIRSFIDAYLVEMQRKGNEPDTTFTDDQLRAVISDLFLAGSETTASALRWGILFMILEPDVQKKVQCEIDDVIGRERRPTSADRIHMPYTEAVLMEIQRMGSIVPFGAPHGNTEHDVRIEGFDVPKQSVVVGNVWAVHHDPTYWPFPDEFNPKNFLDDDGQVIYRERLIPFLIGRRSCPGESLAKMELFLFFTFLLQRYTFSIPAGASQPSTDGILSITLQPQPFSVLLGTRSDTKVTCTQMTTGPSNEA